MSKLSDFLVEYFIILSILVFAVCYIIFNGLITTGEVKRPLLMTLIVILVGYLLIMDDINTSENIDNEEYNIINNISRPASLEGGILPIENKVKYNIINKNLLKNDNIFLKQSDLKNNTYKLKY